MAESIVFVIEDDPAVSASLCWLIESAGLKALPFATADAFLDAYCPDQAGCLVLDVRLPGMSGLELQQKLHEQGAALPTLFITGYGDVPSAVLAMKGGAVDFIEKPFSDQVFLGRVRCALNRDQRQRQTALHRQQIVQRMDRLTQRERQILNMVLAGQSNRQIAAHLELSIKTIEVHRSNMMTKLHARNVVELVRLVLQADGQQ